MNRVAGLRVLVIGGGIAGLSAAWWLRAIGCEVEVVEQAPSPGHDSTMHDFYGPGFSVAAEMGLLPELQRRSVPLRRWVFEDKTGMRVTEIAYPDLQQTIFHGRHLTLTKGDLEQALRSRVEGAVPIRYGVTVTAIRPYGPRIVAGFSEGRTGTYDFVVGAGGTHWATRRAWFCHDAECERYLGFDVTSFSVNDPGLRMVVGDDLRSLSADGRQATICPGRAGRVHVTFLHRRPKSLDEPHPHRVGEVLENAFGDFGPAVVRRLVAAAPYAEDLTHEGLVQMRLPSWSIGRMVLVGDACHCPSAIGGPGASLAMAGARALAAAFEKSHGNIQQAFRAYERGFRPEVDRAQAIGERMVKWVAPRSKLRMLARDVALRTALWPVTSRVMGRVIGA
jgi:2-polyprenyl-6-methoxyphenol hydroxylase-like FAD-dependent oxidoreductase